MQLADNMRKRKLAKLFLTCESCTYIRPQVHDNSPRSCLAITKLMQCKIHPAAYDLNIPITIQLEHTHVNTSCNDESV